jgi:molybdenum cofactor biosynthesis enzyme MoaA
MSTETLYHVTLLTNLTRGYDKYRRSYSKSHIPESRFPDRFFLLRREEIAIGAAKGRALLDKTRLPGDRLIALQTHAGPHELLPNTRTGLGRYVERDWVDLDALHFVRDDLSLLPVRIEEALAESLRVLAPALKPYEQLAPRSVSVLPVAIGCEAACPFCFSKASVSSEQTTKPIDWMRVRRVLREGRRRGAERAVITGGGEPGLLPFAQLVRLVRECADALPRTVLITNGYFLQRMSSSDRHIALEELAHAGLRVLSVSRHHPEDGRNTALMNLDTRPQSIAAVWPVNGLRLRWVCVLQRGGVDSAEAIASYLDWSTALGVTEICFKELYVSTSHESVYHSREANEWSHRHQVPLRLILDFARSHGWVEVERLPWGAPVFRGDWNGHTVQVAAYTEPSLFWERANGLVRSWNLMADGRCLASLEDRSSEVLRHELPTVSSAP